MLEKLEYGSVVLYEGKPYKIMYIYSSGYCEIKKEGVSLNNGELVHISELTGVIEEK
ncbi:MULTISPECIES: hypothetical protein [Metabacillus]|uniref:Cyclic nucleotide-binding domain-containing protein n=1 Tax=Metabacillus rhizolycopersici TaxID=2875709 RepID=A0ABS7V0H2_9BACI|nr:MULTISPECIES: hypothetical protein [Metabacillus]MBZ5753779.1 hypothetical protein [Metabacillus rhizolycopersici]MCM3655518.1 hypothetical protein [Metabacillus litoralis]